MIKRISVFTAIVVLVMGLIFGVACTPATKTEDTTTTTSTTTISLASILYRAVVSVPTGNYLQSDGINSFSHTIASFYIGKYDVTYELWYVVYQWAIANGYTFINAGQEGSTG